MSPGARADVSEGSGLGTSPEGPSFFSILQMIPADNCVPDTIQGPEDAVLTKQKRSLFS